MPFLVDAASFDGTNDYMSRGAVPDGLADGQKGTLSFWVKMTAQDDIDQKMVRSTGAGIDVYRSFANLISIELQDSTGSFFLTFNSTGTVKISSGWVHVLASWDTNFGIGAKLAQIYLNDVSGVTINDTTAAFTINYANINFWFGAGEGGFFKSYADYADVWFDATTRMDLSVESNRRKFITSGLCPVNLGTDGSTPTGTAPIIYFHLDDGEAVANFATNRGTGGNFTITGALATAGTSPSDGCIDPSSPILLAASCV